MLRVARDPAAAPLSPAEQYGLELLLDLSRLVVLEGAGDVVTLRVHEGAPAATIAAAVQAEWHIQKGDATVNIARGTLAQVTAIAGAEAEHRSQYLDHHGRVPSTENGLARERLEREPVLAHAAAILRNAVVAAAGGRLVRLVQPWPDGKRWAVAITHDLDVVSGWP